MPGWCVTVTPLLLLSRSVCILCELWECSTDEHSQPAKGEPCMNAPSIRTAHHHTPLLDVSPVLEYGSPTPLSTHWIPLHELIMFWTHPETVQLPQPVA